MLEETQHRTIVEQEAINRLSFIRGALLAGTKPEIIPSEKNIKLMDTAIEALETIAKIRNQKISLEGSIERYTCFYQGYKKAIDDFKKEMIRSSLTENEKEYIRYKAEQLKAGGR